MKSFDRFALRDVFRAAGSAFSKRQRRVWLGQKRAFVEYRKVARDEEIAFAKRLEAQLGRAAWARSIRLELHSRRVVIELGEGSPTELDVVRFVELAERGVGIDNASFDEAHEHPADHEPAERLLVELAADLASFAVGASLSATPLPPSAVAGTVGAVTAVVRGSAKLREGLERRFGVDRADLGSSLVMSAANAFAQRPVSSLVDVAHKATLLREVQAQRRTWQARERELPVAGGENSRPEERPVPLPRGPIEQYADRAWLVSLTGFGVSFLTTRNVQRAVSALFGGLPKPARLGRDAFASTLAYNLAERRVLVVDRDVLRRLDRIDCIVLQGDLVSRDRFEVGEVITQAPLDTSRARAHVLALLDPDQPLEVRRSGSLALGPVKLLDAKLEPSLAGPAEELARRGALTLALAQDDHITALIELRIVPQTGVEELITAAHEASMRVVVASDDDGVLQRLHADDSIPSGPGMESGIRRLQREGRAVMLVGTGASARSLAAADCGVGLLRSGDPAPWGAHVICGGDLLDVRYLLQACVSARRVAKQSVNVALGAASVGTLISAGGVIPMTTRRIMAVVNTATLVAMAGGARASYSLSRQALPPPRDRTPWHAIDARGALERLGTSSRGLTRGEAVHRKRRTLTKERLPVFELLDHISDELFNPLAPLLAAGAGLSAVVGSLSDAAMVGSVVLLNAGIGGVQRFRAERAIKDLGQHAARNALVRRGGELLQIPGSDVVRGDIVLLSAGEVVPADCRIIEAESLEVDASSLTGESLPVKKSALVSFEREVADRSCILYEGTAIASGRAVAVAVATGDQTEARRGGPAAAGDGVERGVEKRLSELVDLTLPVAVAAAAGVVGVGVLRGRKLSDVVASGVSLAVASVPEGLPLIATAAQLAAAERLGTRGALVRNHRSVEALGRVDLLCVDKTGTVTQGRIELSIVSDGVDEESVSALAGPRVRALAAALRASPDPRTTTGVHDPTDAALWRAAEGAAVTPAYGAEGWRRVSELAFEAGRSYHAVLGQVGVASSLSVKGAPEVVLPQCSAWLRGSLRKPLADGDAERLARVAAELARRGLRVLAVAERSVGAEDRLDPSRPVGLGFLGFLAFSDPVRPTAAKALADLAEIGVQTVMITGDHPSTAEAIASELGLLGGRKILTGAELSRLSEEELDATVIDVGVFARLTPSQKVRIVRALQRAGRCVAMVGDGANDAPAIRLANVGIAIGEHSTAAARGAADIVLTDERIETLVHAIIEGRAVWKSVRDAVSILVGGNLGEIGFTLAGSVIDGRPPLNARQLLLVNLLTDVGPAMAVALKPPDPETLASLGREGPDASLAEPLKRDVAARALVTAGGAGAAWLTARALGGRERASTVGLLALVGTQLGQTLVSGGFSRPVVLTSVASAAVLGAVVQTPVVSHFFGCRPLGPVGVSTAIGASALATFVSAKYPEAVSRIAHRLRLFDVVPTRDPEQLTDGGRR